MTTEYSVGFTAKVKVRVARMQSRFLRKPREVFDEYILTASVRENERRDLSEYFEVASKVQPHVNVYVPVSAYRDPDGNDKAYNLLTLDSIWPDFPPTATLSAYTGIADDRYFVNIADASYAVRTRFEKCGYQVFSMKHHNCEDCPF